MLAALMDGRALTATELAGVAVITPQRASCHLAQLMQARLITVERLGRHRTAAAAPADGGPARRGDAQSPSLL